MKIHAAPEEAAPDIERGLQDRKQFVVRGPENQ